MPRKSRKFFSNGFFHVMVQGIDKSYIFNKQEYKTMYFKIIKKYYINYNISIIAYCIMSNHCHFIIYTKDINELSLFMHKINTIYAGKYNELEERVGYVFRDRFKSEYIDNMNYLIKCIKYIHMNPVKAEVTTSEQNYIFSSYKEYNGKREIIDLAIIQEFFGCDKFNIMLDNINEIDVEIMDIDDNGVNLERMIKIYLDKGKLNLEKVKKDKNELYKFIKELVNKGYKQNKIGEKIGIHPRQISRIIKKRRKRGKK